MMKRFLTLITFCQILMASATVAWAQNQIILQNQALEELPPASASAVGTTDCESAPCPCDGYFTAMEVFWLGEDDVIVQVYRDLDLTELLLEDNDVDKGDMLSLSPASPLGLRTYFKVTNSSGEECVTAIWSRCPNISWPGARDDQAVLGKNFRDFLVFSYTDEGNTQYCTLENVIQDWHVGGNIVGGINTLGTINDEAVVFITNDETRGTITNTGEFGINTLTPDARMDVQGDVIIEETLDVNGVARVNDTSGASDPSGGALIVAGGAGIAENLHIGNDLGVNNNGFVLGNLGVGTNSPDVQLDVHGQAIIEQTLDVNGITMVNDNTPSTSASEGAFVVAGGAGIGQNLYVNNNLGVDNEGYVLGNLGIGTIDPSVKLDIVGNRIRLSPTLNSSNSLNLQSGVSGFNINARNDNLFIRSTNGNNVFINTGFGDGKVGIGSTNLPNILGIIPTGNYRLFVEGGILTEEVLVRTGWADFVFEPSYHLKPLEEVKQFIDQHGHLPDTSPAEKIEKEGLKLAEATVNQQVKIEELYLYMIRMNQEVKALKTENERLKERLRQLEQK